MTKTKANEWFKLLPLAIHKGQATPRQNIEMIHAESMWKQGYEGQDTVIAIIDTGIDYNHNALKENIIGGFNFTDEGENTDFMDNNFHGTHVAGIVKSVAPKTKLLILKALNKDGHGYYQWIIDAIKYATAWRGESGERVNVINMSLGGIEVYEMHDAIQDAVKENILVACAGGNAGDSNADTDELSYPGAFSEVVSVGAVDFEKKIAWFSNSNDEIDVVAPGVDIYSTIPGGEYERLSGTSMATPHVAGACALLINQFRDEFNKNPLEAQLYAQVCKRVKALSMDKKEQGNGLIDLTYKNVPVRHVLIFREGKDSYVMDGVNKKMDTEAIIVDGRFLVPLRITSEEMKADSIRYNPQTKEAIIEWED